MSTVYNKTDNYGLNLYGDNDPADLRDGYNGSMRTIDTTLETHLNRIEGVESRETHDEEVVKALLGDNTVDSATAAKNGWDKAGTDAAAAENKADNNTTVLTALGAETVDKATELKKTVDDLKAEADKKTLLVFGDSISVGAQAGISKNYVAQVAEYLGYTVKNYAINGSAFYGTRGGSIVDIGQQILTAYNDGALDKTKIGMIILGGGVNDTSDGNTIEQTYNGAKNCAQLLTQYFPNIPTYIMVGQGNGNWQDKTYMHNRLPFYSQIITAFNHYGKCTVINAWAILIGYPTDQGDSPWLVYNNLPDTHPSQTGHNIMASYLIGCINGSNIGKYAVIANEIPTDGTPIYNHLTPESLSLSVVETSDIAYTLIFDCDWRTQDTTENEDYIFAYANNNKLFSPGYSFTASGSYVDDSGKISICNAIIKFNKDNQFTIKTGHRDTSISGQTIHLHAEHANILWN